MGIATSIFSGSSGLNTVADPIRLPYNPETGITDLAVAINITVNQYGSINRRPGYTKITDLIDAHSLFCDKGICLVVSNQRLYRVLEDGNIDFITGLLSNVPMSYAQASDGFVYFSNDTDLGRVNPDGDLSDWELTPYVGPTTDRYFTGPEACKHIREFSGRLLVFEGNVLYWSEPYGYGLFDRTRNFIHFSTDGQMIKPVEGGVFVSDAKNTYFLKGKDPGKWGLQKVANYPALDGSDAIDYVDAAEIGLSTITTGNCALWTSLHGACLGTPDGQFFNLTKDKVIYPSVGTEGASLLRGYNLIQSIGA